MYRLRPAFNWICFSRRGRPFWSLEATSRGCLQDFGPPGKAACDLLPKALRSFYFFPHTCRSSRLHGFLRILSSLLHFTPNISILGALIKKKRVCVVICASLWIRCVYLFKNTLLLMRAPPYPSTSPHQKPSCTTSTSSAVQEANSVSLLSLQRHPLCV